jgi:hypothetical protein
MQHAIGTMLEIELLPHELPVANCRSLNIGERKLRCLHLESLLLISVASQPLGSVDSP